MRNLLLFSLIFLGGCLVGPDYRRPAIDAPDEWTLSLDAAVATADRSWWEGFEDTVLNRLVETSLQQNLDLRIAAARIDQYLGLLETTRSALFPQIGAAGSVARQQDTATGPASRLIPKKKRLQRPSPGLDDSPSPSVAANSPYTLYQAGLNAAWEIDLWGRLRRNTEAAQAELLASEEGRRGVLLTLVSDVVSSYLNLRSLDRQLEIARQTETNYAETLRLFNLRFEYGAVSQLEVSQVASQYQGARQTIPRLEAQIARQADLLNFLLDQNPGTPLPRGQSIDELVAPPVPAGLPSELLTRRPDILQSEQRLIAANARIGAARALYFPSVSLTGLLGTATINSDQLFDNKSQTWQVKGGINLPLFTFGSIEGQVKSAEAGKEELHYAYRQTIRNAFREVEDALNSTLRGNEQLAAQGEQVRQLAIYAQLAEMQYDAGMTSYLQVLDANRSLFDNQLDYARNRGITLRNSVDLYRALGGGWDLDGLENRFSRVPAPAKRPEE